MSGIRVPSLRSRQVIAALERAGFVKVRHGKHAVFAKAGHPRIVSVPVHPKPLKRGTLKNIIAQAGLTLGEFLALL